MKDTPLSLLDRVRRDGHSSDWDRLVALYSPLLRSWLESHPLQGADIDDLLQDVLKVMFLKVPQFIHPGTTGAFRSWLRTILVYRLRWHWRESLNRSPGIESVANQQYLERLEQPESDLSQQWDLEHDRFVVAGLFEVIKSEFTQATWKAFQLYAVEGRPPAEVAAELGLTVNAVCIARSRVLRRLRQEAAGLLDD